MSDTTFELDFITPERVIISKRAEMVVVPGVEGDIGVLPGHSSLITRLRPGMVCVFTNNVVEKRVFVESGIAQIEADKCIILIEKAEDEESLDKAEILGMLKEKEANPKEADGSEVAILRAKLALLENLPYA